MGVASKYSVSLYEMRRVFFFMIVITGWYLSLLDISQIFSCASSQCDLVWFSCPYVSFVSFYWAWLAYVFQSAYFTQLVNLEKF